jgi:predicted transcriptional regulator
MTDDTNATLLLTAKIAAAHVSHNKVAITDIAPLITKIHGALVKLGREKLPEATKQAPAIAIRASITPDYIICLEDGKRYKILKNHLMATYGMTPKEYRAKWNLPANYPMVAPNYAAKRSAIAYKIGLGRKRSKS